MNDDPNVAEEVSKMGYEPLLAIEIKLIVWSLVLGTTLLAVLVWISYRFFPGQ